MGKNKVPSYETTNTVACNENMMKSVERYSPQDGKKHVMHICFGTMIRKTVGPNRAQRSDAKRLERLKAAAEKKPTGFSMNPKKPTGLPGISSAAPKKVTTRQKVG